MRHLLITIEGDSPDECGPCQLKYYTPDGPCCKAILTKKGLSKVLTSIKKSPIRTNRLPACITAQEAATKEEGS